MLLPVSVGIEVYYLELVTLVDRLDRGDVISQVIAEFGG
jgi:hypothetical protein